MTKAVIHVNHAEHQKTHAAAIKAGLERHGIATEFAPYDKPTPCDFAVVWGWHQSRVIKSGVPLLVMERGHLQPRTHWTSLGWNGLARRGTYPKAADGGKRWNRLFGDTMKDWRIGRKHVLVMGQVAGDAALAGLDIDAWAQQACDTAKTVFAEPVVFRPHPIALERGMVRRIAGAAISHATLREDLAGAVVAITYNSTAGVDAALAGVPVIAMDPGSMAWPVATHRIEDGVMLTDRTAWAHDLAWTSWSLAEITDGAAWEAVAPLMTARAA